MTTPAIELPTPIPGFIPKEAITSSLPHEIIALIGAPGSGKTTAALTFPNRIWVDFDHKLPQGELSVPFWDSAFCDKLAKRTIANTVNRRDAFKKWLRENHDKFTPEQTIILDSWTFMQNSFDIQTELEESMADKPNPYSFWKRKIQYSIEICNLLKACRGRVVVTFHETVERNDEGQLTGKIRPVMDGSFKDQLLGHFTDVWRQQCNPPDVTADGKVRKENMRTVYKQGWFWQLIGDEVINCNTNPVLGAKVRAAKLRMILADYNEVLKIYNT